MRSPGWRWPRAGGEPSAGNTIIGAVVHIFIREDGGLITNRFHTDPAKLRAVGRMGRTGHVRTGDAGNRFDMPMGKPALK